MTYCCGFMYRDCAFLFADSAITIKKSVPGAPQTTSFGEKIIENPNEFIFEGGVKIHKISERCSVALAANDVFRALELIDILRSLHNDNQEFLNTINLLNNNLGPLSEEKGREVGFLIATSIGDIQHLYKWESTDRKLVECKEFCDVGSLPRGKEKSIRELYEYFNKSKTISEKALLAGFAAGIQSVSIKEGFFGSHNAGGAVTGLKIDQTGMEWLGDTAYEIYDPIKGFDHFVMIANREGGFATFSSYTEKPMYFVVAENFDEGARWQEKWRDSFDHAFKHSLATNRVFMNSSNNAIVVIQTNKPTSKTSVYTVNFKGESRAITNLNTVNEIMQKAARGIFVFDEETAKERLEIVCIKIAIRDGTTRRSK